jgi:PAS domain S-box-containing protein
MFMEQKIDLESFVRDAADAIIIAGTDGSILLWNLAAERIFGYTEAEALGQSLDLIIPERFRARHSAGFREVMRTGHTRYGTDVLRVPASGKDGKDLSIAFTVTLLFRPDRQVFAIGAIVRDDTARWKEERALRKRLAELEPRKS